MNRPEQASSAELDLSQEELKALFDGIDQAVKRPDQTRPVHVKDQQSPPKKFHTLVVSGDDARQVMEADLNEDNLDPEIQIMISDPVRQEVFTANSILITFYAGLPGSKIKTAFAYSLRKEHKRQWEASEYHLIKTPTGISQPIEVVDAGEITDSLVPLSDVRVVDVLEDELGDTSDDTLSDAEFELESELYKAETKITQADVDRLQSLAKVLQS